MSFSPLKGFFVSADDTPLGEWLGASLFPRLNNSVKAYLLDECVVEGSVLVEDVGGLSRILSRWPLSSVEGFSNRVMVLHVKPKTREPFFGQGRNSIVELAKQAR